MDFKSIKNLIDRKLIKLRYELRSRDSYIDANYESGGKWGSYAEALKELESWEQSLREYTEPSKLIESVHVTNTEESIEYVFYFTESCPITLVVKDGLIISNSGETLGRNILAAMKFVGTEKWK